MIPFVFFFITYQYSPFLSIWNRLGWLELECENAPIQNNQEVDGLQITCLAFLTGFENCASPVQASLQQGNGLCWYGATALGR
jgi:hypothetical protein